MGHSLSADKRERQNVVRALHNKLNRSTLKKELKTFDKVLKEKPADAQTALSKVWSALDRAARKNAIPKARADRKKARLALAVERLKTASKSA
ncbi:MAG: 30S ribosomal protein S20 [Planctomycetes bacterium]|nr:30S ribosomal protein S20 [Planctomycetota bacterium]